MSRRLTATVLDHVKEMVGQPCRRPHVGNDRSLMLGFGEFIRHESAVSRACHGTWEIGTYDCSWRIIHGGRIACASQDVVGGIDELRRKIGGVEWGRFSAVSQPTDFDVRVEFDNGVFVDFLATISDDDEIVHIFLPNSIVVVFSIAGGWLAGPSDQPWVEDARGTERLAPPPRGDAGP